ncbi:fluoride efflux transporter FluC [Halobacteriaceae archaeon GCM10025711]
MNPLLLVGVGGAAGALSRYVVGRNVARHSLDTLAVNVAGSLLLGALVAAPVNGDALLLVGTGFCGALTTFSTFAFETVRFVETDGGTAALRNAALNLGGALVAVGVGATAVRVLL